ncbi:MAG: DUF3473 domain-containing protein [Nitrospirota bacterium]|nr:DUF3473 domain-containing protein [Nitrospirota bacterium]
MNNALSIDLEDWFCVYNMSRFIDRSSWDSCELRVRRNTERLLALLERRRVKATFFVLGWIAERVPDLISSIEQQGHEIATHGYSHELITNMTPAAFESDLKRALEVTRQCVRQHIHGFRAPSFSITQRTKWALPILEQNGITYDSSIYPIGFHPDYGIGDSPLGIYAHSPSLVEVPLSCAEVLGRRIPCSGGGYFRLLPYAATKFLMRLCNKQGRPVIFYLHPWEIDPDQPRVNLTASKRLRHYLNLHRTMDRLERLLRDLPFTTIREILHEQRAAGTEGVLGPGTGSV